MLALIVALLVMGGVAVLVEAQSPSSIYWTGVAVSGSSERGLVYYRYHGQEFTIPDPRRGAADVRPVGVRVFLDPEQPSIARTDGLARWTDAVLVLGWFVVAAALVPVGVLRQRRRRRRRAALAAGSAGLVGWGLPRGKDRA